ncbi:GH1 family beta-glucosidase [Clostridium sp. DL1XJH146]
MFSRDFIFGVATSSYQIEGTKTKDGYIESIWDDFAKKPGKILDKSDGKIACQHVKYYKEDVALMKRLGVDSYRFSISWARIMPKEGEISQEGIQFYKNLLLELKESGIKASVTMYHWDLPLWIYEKNGGWISRDTAYLFLDYVKVIVGKLDEYVDQWITLNEPLCSSFLGYLIGNHAPGHRDVTEYIKAVHHLNLAHGLAVDYYKNRYNKPIGIVLVLTQVYAADNSYNNKLAAKVSDAVGNRAFLDPIFKGKYPDDLMMLLSIKVSDFSFIEEGDLEIISSKIDFLGANFYTHTLVEYDPTNLLISRGVHTEHKKTGMDWDITPYALYDMVKRVRNDYTDIPIYITENGSAWDDKLDEGKVHDEDRINYLNDHLQIVSKLNDEGMNVVGYFAWSLMDNYEWAFGYVKRFGIVYVDYETQKRYPKDSYYRYQEIIKSRKL